MTQNNDDEILLKENVLCAIKVIRENKKLRDCQSICDYNGTRTHKHLVRKRTLNHLAKLAKCSSCVVNTYLYGAFDLCSHHITYLLQSESTLYICLNIKEILVRNRRDIWNLSDCSGTRTRNHSVCKQTLNHLVKLAKGLSYVVSSYLYGAFDYMFLSNHILISEWIDTQFRVNCSHLNFRYRACFEQGVPWYSGKYKVWIHSEISTWHDKNTQSHTSYR